MKKQHKYCYINYSPSSMIVTVALERSPCITLRRNDSGTIIMLKFSLPSSNTLSSTIEISNGTIVDPAGTVTKYGPGL